jgi:hypothetical protein
MAAVSRRLAIIRLRQPVLNLSCPSGFTNLDTGQTSWDVKPTITAPKPVECDKSANSTYDSYIKSQFEDLARQWRELAEQADKAGR